MVSLAPRWLSLGLGALLLIFVAACGGGGGGDGGGEDPDVLVGLSFSTGSLDGWVRSDGAHDATDIPRSGDLDLSVSGTFMVACYTFGLGAMTPGSEIRGATLTVQVIGNDGNPYVQHGDMMAHYNPYGDSLANVFSVAVMNPPTPVPFAPSTVAVGAKEADVREMVQRALDSGFDRLQVILSFAGPAMPDNSLDDFVMLSDGEGTVPGQPAPTLSFQWVEP